jgi:hypothetical protein
MFPSLQCRRESSATFRLHELHDQQHRNFLDRSPDLHMQEVWRVAKPLGMEFEYGQGSR